MRHVRCGPGEVLLLEIAEIRAHVGFAELCKTVWAKLSCLLLAVAVGALDILDAWLRWSGAGHRRKEQKK